LQVVPNQKLVQDWAEKSWDVSSKVTFTLKGSNGGTTVDLVHEGVPEGSIESISDGWKEYYMGQIQTIEERTMASARDIAPSRVFIT
jgi:activator of HSP90 ATPase